VRAGLSGGGGAGQPRAKDEQRSATGVVLNDGRRARYTVVMAGGRCGRNGFRFERGMSAGRTHQVMS
jgi:hypothetical protein